MHLSKKNTVLDFCQILNNLIAKIMFFLLIFIFKFFNIYI